MFRRFLTPLVAAVGLLIVPAVVPVLHGQIYLGLPAAHATAGTWVLMNQTRTDFLNGTIRSGDTHKIALYTDASNISAASTSCSGITSEVGTTNTGYTAGGVTTGITLTGTTSVTWSFTTNPTWTAGSANLTAKWALDCDTTASLAVAFVTLDSGGADVTTTSGQTLTIADTTGNPVFTFA